MRKLATTVGIVALLLLVVFLLWLWLRPGRGTTGEVSTRFHWLGPND